MKRIIALLTMFAMLLSFTAVGAAPAFNEEFLKLVNPQITEGNVQAKIQLGGNIPMLDMLGGDGMAIKALLNSSVDYEVNLVSNDELTKMQADGRMMFNSGAESFGIPSLGFDMWVNADIENTENMQYFIIIKMIGDGLNEYIDEMSNKYIVMDYTKIPGFKELIKGLADLGLFNQEKMEELVGDIVDEEKLMELINRLYEGIDINPVYADGKYSIVMGDAEIKALFVNLFNNIINVAIEISNGAIGEEELAKLEAAKTELSEILAPIADIQIFDAERGLVVEVSEDGKTAHAEINIATNLYDFSAALDPAGTNAQGIDRAFFDINLSLTGDMVVNPLPAGYTVDYPELNSDNSFDVFASQYGRDISFEMLEAAQKADDRIEIVYNGNVVEFENKPMIINDRTFVAFRNLANILGIDDEHIGYDDATQRVYLKSGDIEIEMYIGSSVVYVNGEMKVLDVPAFTCNDRTYIPARFVAEMFGKTVGYSEDGGVQTITIND